VEDACVFGEGRPFLGALVTVDVGAGRTLLGADAVGMTDATVVQHPSVRRAIEAHVVACNATLSAEERVHRVAVLADHWTPGSAELTPTDKLRRADIARRYAERIEALYRTGR
jgi:long-subunit acyl-CoA synthetase (AMP-forming)